MVTPRDLIIDTLADRTEEQNAARLLGKWATFLDRGIPGITVTETFDIDAQKTHLELTLSIDIEEATNVFLASAGGR